MTKRRFSPSMLASGALLAGVATAPLGAQVACDTLQTGTRFAALGDDRPFTHDSAGGDVLGRRRHAVFAPGTGVVGGNTAPMGAARGSRVRKDGTPDPRLAVRKDRSGMPVRKDSVPGGVVQRDSSQRPFCPQLTVLGGGGGTLVPDGAMQVATETAPGDVVPPSRLPGARGGWFSLPRVLGGLLLGGTAVALGGGSDGDTPALVTPLVPTTPIAPTPPGTPTTPSTPTTPATPGTPTTPGTSPTPDTPTPPSTPLVPVTPGTPTPPGTPTTPTTPITPTDVVPEPTSLALVALGGVGVAAGARRRRR